MNTESLYAPRDQPEKESKRKKKERHGVTKLQWARPVTLFSKGTFIPSLVHRGKWKMQGHAESAQTLQQFCPYWSQDFFLHTFPTNDIVYIIFWPWRPVDILWPSFDKGCSTRKLIFPWNVFFFYIFNLCQPQKVLNKLYFSRSKGAVSYKKEPISSKVWCG